MLPRAGFLSDPLRETATNGHSSLNHVTPAGSDSGSEYRLRGNDGELLSKQGMVDSERSLATPIIESNTG